MFTVYRANDDNSFEIIVKILLIMDCEVGKGYTGITLRVKFEKFIS